MGDGARAMEGLAMNAAPGPDFWRGKRVLLTGHTGFKGAWLAQWLHRLGARVTGLALPAVTEPNLFDLAGVAGMLEHRIADLRDAGAVAAIVRESRPEIVFHLAAQALVRESYREPVATWGSNLMGTVHLLDALRQHPGARVAVFITTDKVYRNREQRTPYREGDELGGHDPYSASKAACELAIASYRDAFLKEQGLALASARAGNVIGGGDWAADRLLPDAVRAWQSGGVLDIRHSQAVRPWQHVLEPLAAYLVLAQALWRDASLACAWNFGPAVHERATVRQVVELARAAWGGGNVRYAEQMEGPHEAGLLTLDATQAQNRLGVRPRWNLEESIQRTFRWYRAWHESADALDLCQADFDAWESGE